MELHNDFTIAASVEDAWPALTELATVVPCLPGATLDSVEGQAFTGRMTIKLGPMSLSYRGEGKISPDQAARSIVVEASGGEQRGGGSAAATITAVMEPVTAGGTRVRVTTDVDLTGKPAQFGRGILVDVAGRLLDTFATNLERELQGRRPAEGVATVAPRSVAAAPPLDLGSVGAAVVVKRVAPVLVGALVGFAVGRLVRSRGR